MKKPATLFSLVIVAASLAIAPSVAAKPAKQPSWAQSLMDGQAPTHGGYHGPAGRMSLMQVAEQSRVPLAQVIAAINAVEPGEQLDTRIINENGRAVYEVRWQASRGRIIIFRVDAETGQILSRQG